MSESRSCSITPKIRYTSPPTQFDIAPFGTLCSVMKNDEGTESELFIQASVDEEEPLWLSAAEIVLKRFKNDLQNPCFIISCLEELQRSDAPSGANQEK